MAAKRCLLLLVVFGLAAAGVRAALADTFTNKQTGEVLRGRLLGTAFKDGKEMLLVKTEDGKLRHLPRVHWSVSKEEQTPPEPESGQKPSEDPAAGEGHEWPAVTYNGKARDAKWLEKAYARFKDQIALIEGRYFDLGAGRLWAAVSRGGVSRP